MDFVVRCFEVITKQKRKLYIKVESFNKNTSEIRYGRL